MAWNHYLRHISIDCVVFGFLKGTLNVLLVKMKGVDELYLPGSFVYKSESLDEAAGRILRERTGVEHVFLRQFYTFGDPARTESHMLKFPDLGTAQGFLSERFISIGYYALLNPSSIETTPDQFSEDCRWYPLGDLPALALDHEQIIMKALETLQLQLNYQPIGLSLMPEEFTMGELQQLYEAILGKKLDRSNFQRKMLGFDILVKHEQPRKTGAHRAAYVYSFSEEKYEQALKLGLRGGW